jgi:hypothetical protein
MKKFAHRLGIIALVFLTTANRPAWGDDAKVEVPRIESVVPLARQPQQDNPSTIWYDDFNGPEKRYGDHSGSLDDRESFGGAGKSLACFYDKGSQGVGNRKVFFGDYPANARVVRKGEKFDEIYWRVYVKHQHGWTGGGEAKLSRATSLTSANWTQAMIAHVWSGPGDTLTLDPASGVRGDHVVTTKYNDFSRLRWLGNVPASQFKFSSAAESGWWVCVESHARLNTPGKKDGLNQLWIDGRLEVERKNLDWRGSYTAHGINAVFLESYWNQTSPVRQTRWIDNFVISTQPIGPVVCPPNPILIKTPYYGPGKLSAWEVELGSGGTAEPATVWKSNLIHRDDERVEVDAATGQFAGILAGKEKLASNATYYCRVRQQGDGEWSNWSPWHQGFRTGG